MPAMPVVPAIPAMPAMPFVPEMDMPVSVVVVHSSARSGLMVENLTPQLGDFFGAKNGKGVLVRSVEKGSRAEQAGFRAGDVIVKVNGESISDSGDFTHAIHGRKNSAVTVSIIREKKEQNLTLTVPDHNQSQLLDMDETLEVPDTDMDAETVIDLSEAQAQIAHLQPEIERAVREVRIIGPDMEEATRELRNHQEELKQEMRELERELKDQEREIQENQKVKMVQPEADI